ncbi:MAG: dynamin family protein [Mycobacterium leprae]
MTRPYAELLNALDRLAHLVDADETSALTKLRRRAEQGVFRVLVVGEAKRGKSTLINALLGRAVLPAGVVPLTALPTTITYGDADGVDTAYLDGRFEQTSVDALAEFVTEKGNPGNRRGVATVTARLPAPLLAKGLELVDTPGTGSVYVHNTDEATQALARMDAAVFVLAADPPISASERKFLRAVRRQAVALFCVLNKIDYLGERELAQAWAFTERVLADEVGRPVAVWPVSARSALAAREAGDVGALDAGVLAFESALTGYLDAHQGRDLLRSIAGRAGTACPGSRRTGDRDARGARPVHGGARGQGRRVPRPAHRGSSAAVRERGAGTLRDRPDDPTDERAGGGAARGGRSKNPRGGANAARDAGRPAGRRRKDGGGVRR